MKNLGRIIAVVCLVAAAIGAAYAWGRLSPAPPSAPPPAASSPAPRDEAGTRPSSEPVTVGQPTRVEIPALGVDEALAGYGLKSDGAMELPPYGDAGWYDRGPRPGETGGAVVVAHVTGPSGPDVFHALATLQPGDAVRVHHTEGVATFVVEDVEDVAKDELPYDRIWPDTDARLLRLITCGGDRLPEGGYPDNTVVYAHLVDHTASSTS